MRKKLPFWKQLRIDRTFKAARDISNEERELSDRKRLLSLRITNVAKLIAAIKGQCGPTVAAAIDKFSKMLPQVEKFLTKSASPNNLAVLSECPVCVQAFLELAEIVDLARSWHRDHAIVALVDEIVPKLRTVEQEYRNIFIQWIYTRRGPGLRSAGPISSDAFKHIEKRLLLVSCFLMIYEYFLYSKLSYARAITLITFLLPIDKKYERNCW